MNIALKIAKESAAVFSGLCSDERLLSATEDLASLITDCLKRGGKILICGNGGSAADAQHFAAELVGSFMIKDRPGLAAVALTADTSVLTSLCNDMGVEKMFSRQVQALGRGGDLLVGITTSGRSKNVINAFEAAIENGMKTAAFVGQLSSEAQIMDLSDIVLEVRSSSTPRIQEVHALLIHIICEIVEMRMNIAKLS